MKMTSKLLSEYTDVGVLESLPSYATLILTIALFLSKITNSQDFSAAAKV
jgi:hypothetical protein